MTIYQLEWPCKFFGPKILNPTTLTNWQNFIPLHPSHPTRKSRPYTPAPRPPIKRPVIAGCPNPEMNCAVESSPARPPIEDSDSSWYAFCIFSLIPQYLILIDYNLLKYCIDYGHGRGYFCIIMLRKRPIR